MSFDFIRRSFGAFSSCLLFIFVSLSDSAAQTSKGPGESKPLISFCVMGDVPYEPYEDTLLALQITGLPEDIPFLVHVGDIKRGNTPCDEAVYRKVAGMLEKSKRPVFIIPGDNEYNDCSDPGTAWNHWVAHFSKFDERWEHGIAVNRQPEREENFAFVRNQVLFVGTHVLGGKVHDVNEWRKRHADCVQWIQENLREHGEELGAAVIFGHATPTPKQAEFFVGLSEAAAEFGKPTVYIHGDSHSFFRDRPFPKVENFYRIQIDRGGIAPPLRVTVKPAEEEPFQTDRRLDQQPEGYPRSAAEAKARKNQ